MKPRTWIEWSAWSTWASMVAAALAFITLYGCSRSAGELTGTPASSWTAEDAMTILSSNMMHNLRKDNRNIVAIVTPYTPEVIEAIVRLEQLKRGLSDSVARSRADRLLENARGVYRDKEGRLWTPRGSYRDDPDSLMFLVSLTNTTFPCDPPTINGIPLLPAYDVPCEYPDLQGIENRIVLTNAEGEVLTPRTWYGRKNNTLTVDEHILVVYDVSGAEGRAFLGKGGLTITIEGLPNRCQFAIK